MMLETGSPFAEFHSTWQHSIHRKWGTGTGRINGRVRYRMWLCVRHDTNTGRTTACGWATSRISRNMTQGESLAELEDNLRDLYGDLTGGEIPGSGAWQSCRSHEARRIGSQIGRGRMYFDPTRREPRLVQKLEDGRRATCSRTPGDQRVSCEAHPQKACQLSWRRCPAGPRLWAVRPTGAAGCGPHHGEYPAGAYSCHGA